MADWKEKMNSTIYASLSRQDFRRHTWRAGELVLAVAEAVLAVALVSYFFYRSVLAMLPLSVIGGLIFTRIVSMKRKRDREALTLQFRECILSVTASLRAGYAVENAFMESRAEMKLLFGEHSAIYRELEQMRRGMVVNITLEELLTDLGERSGIEEIQQFAQVFLIAKRGGGNLAEIIRSSAELIGRRIETMQEIRTILGGRKMEQNIMRIVPFAMLAYIGFSYPGYFDGLYHNLRGGLIMTGCLAVYIAAYLLGDRIMEKIEKQMTG